MKGFLLVLALTVGFGQGFQFMSKWKMPTYDPQAEQVQQRFGDKSKFNND
jgi:hypothetical protein